MTCLTPLVVQVARLKEYSWGMGNWMERVGAEARACRDSVAVFDQSSFAKFLVQGRDACQVRPCMPCLS